MNTTKNFRPHLAMRRTDAAEAARSSYEQRKRALVELFKDAPRKPDALYDLTRSQPRSQLPDERLRAFLQEGLRTGAITKAGVIRCVALLLLEYLAPFAEDRNSAADQLYVTLMTDEAKAVEAQTIAHALPTEAHREKAVRDTMEAITIAQLQCAVLEMRPLPSHPVPMGVR